MIKNPGKLILSLLASALLTACSGGSSTEAETTPTTPPTAAQTIASMEASGQLPTLDRSTALKGADVNTDGVRDDLERHIGSLQDNSQQKAALRQLAKSLDSTLTVDTANETALRSAANELTEAINCVWETYPAETAPNKVEELRRLAVNTRARFEAYAKYNQARSGSVIALPSGSTCK